MSTTNEEVWALQLLRYFMSKGYVQMRFRNSSFAKRKDDLWLICFEERPFQVVRISQSSHEMRRQEASEIELTCLQLQQNLQSSTRILDLSLTDSYEDFETNYIYYSYVHPKKVFGPAILQAFPDLDGAFKEFKNADQEKARLLASIRLLNAFPKLASGKGRSLRRSIPQYAVVALCIVLFAAVYLISRLMRVEEVAVQIALGAYYKALISVCHEYWRFLTAGFLHGGILHLYCNIRSYLIINRTVESSYGVGKTLIILLLSVIGGNAACFALDGNGVALGLSSGIYGLMAAAIVDAAVQKKLNNPGVRVALYRTLFLNLIINMLPEVSVIGHIGGFVTGLVLGIVLHPQCDKLLRINTAICLAILIGATSYLGVRNHHLDEYYLGTDQRVFQIYRDLGLKTHAQKIEKQLLEYYCYYGE